MISGCLCTTLGRTLSKHQLVVTLASPHHFKHSHNDNFMRHYRYSVAVACPLMQLVSINLHCLGAIMQGLASSLTLVISYNYSASYRQAKMPRPAKPVNELHPRSMRAIVTTSRYCHAHSCLSDAMRYICAIHLCEAKMPGLRKVSFDLLRSGHDGTAQNSVTLPSLALFRYHGSHTIRSALRFPHAWGQKTMCWTRCRTVHWG